MAWTASMVEEEQAGLRPQIQPRAVPTRLALVVIVQLFAPRLNSLAPVRSSCTEQRRVGGESHGCEERPTRAIERTKPQTARPRRSSPTRWATALGWRYLDRNVKVLVARCSSGGPATGRRHPVVRPIRPTACMLRYPLQAKQPCCGVLYLELW